MPCRRAGKWAPRSNKSWSLTTEREFADTPYSSDLNPMEQALAKMKALLRKAGARTRAALEQAIREALEAFSPEECRNYFLNCGYEPV